MTGRGSPHARGAIIGAGTFLGGILHSLPFAIPNLRLALITAVIVVLFMVGGGIIASISAVLGGVAG